MGFRHISAVIITFNEIKNIARCIESLKEVTDEIIVVDSFSADGTYELAVDLGATVVQMPWEGYAMSKNKGNQMAKNDWILSIDADEVLSSGLIDSINRIEPAEGTVYWLDRLNFYGEKAIRFSGFYPDWKPRLFNKQHVRWEGNFVHESLEIPAGFKKLKLEGKLFHYTYSSAEDHKARMLKYARLSALKMKDQGRKASFISIWISPITRFFISYFIKLGIFDGKEGFLIAYRYMWATHMKYRLLAEMTKNS